MIHMHSRPSDAGVLSGEGLKNTLKILLEESIDKGVTKREVTFGARLLEQTGLLKTDSLQFSYRS
eukprot:COSAG02_NODE_1170_length_14123_cov_9.614946_4_plen_65_part_00